MKIINFATAILLIGLGNLAFASQPFINVNQLEKVLVEVGSRPVDVADSIPRYSNISKSSQISDQFSQIVKTNIRARMKADPSIDGASVEVLGLPSIIYFPNNPTQNPIKLVQSTNIKIVDYYIDRLSTDEIVNEFLESSGVKLEFNAMNGQKSKAVLFGQNILNDTKTHIDIIDNELFVISLINISDFSEKDATQYFSDYQFRSSALISQLADARNDSLISLQEKYDRSPEGKAEIEKMKSDAKAQAVAYDDFYNSPQTSISALTLPHFFKASDPSEYCECIEKSEKETENSKTYSYYELDDEYNVPVTISSHSSYYDIKFNVFYDRSIDDNQDKLNSMLAAMEEYINSNLPEGATSATVKSTDFYETAEAILKYDLNTPANGKSIEKRTKLFDKFISKNYKKLAKIAKKAK